MVLIIDAKQIMMKLEEFFKDSKKIALMGIGNILRKDDAAGIYIIRGVRERISKSSNIVLIECDSAPENYIGVLKKYHPSSLLYIDAADAHLPPSALFTADLEQIKGITVSTHSIPLNIFADFINTLIKTDQLLFGIQPKDLSFGEGLTKDVEKNVNNAIAIILSALTKSLT